MKFIVRFFTLDLLLFTYNLYHMQKRIYAVIILLTINYFSFAQAPGWLWADQSGGTAAEIGRSTATDAFGNVFVTGYFESPFAIFGTDTLINSGSNGGEVFTIKYDANGNVLWAKSAAGDFSDNGYGIATDASGNCYVTGQYLSTSLTFDTITLVNAASTYYNFFIVKYDPSGNVLWAKNAGGVQHDGGHSVATDPAGNVYAAGSFYSNKIIFGNDTLFRVGNDDIFLVKYDSSGNVLWARSKGGNQSDIALGLAANAAGECWMSGLYASASLTFGSSVITNTSTGTYDVFIAKYDSSGNALWAGSGGGTSDDAGYSISIDAANNCYVTGTFASPSVSFGGTALLNEGNENFFIAKSDNSGNFLWAHSGGGSAIGWGFDIAADANGNSFIAGVFSSDSMTVGSTVLTNVNPVLGYYDIFLAGYDTGGNSLWAKSAGGEGTDWSFGNSLNAAGNIYITGYFSSDSLAFDNTTLVNTNTSFDFYIAATDVTTLIRENENSSGVLAVFPNPASEQVNIRCPWDMDEVVVSNVLSGTVLHVYPGIKSFSFPVKSDGVYFITVSTKKQRLTKKAIVIGSR
jgi:hypothetical protein